MSIGNLGNGGGRCGFYLSHWSQRTNGWNVRIWHRLASTRIDSHRLASTRIETDPCFQGGFGVPGTLIGGNFEYKDSPYDAYGNSIRQDKKAHRDKMGEKKAFISTARRIECFDSNQHCAASSIYSLDGVTVSARRRRRSRSRRRSRRRRSSGRRGTREEEGGVRTDSRRGLRGQVCRRRSTDPRERDAADGGTTPCGRRAHSFANRPRSIAVVAPFAPARLSLSHERRLSPAPRSSRRDRRRRCRAAGPDRPSGRGTRDDATPSPPPPSQLAAAQSGQARHGHAEGARRDRARADQGLARNLQAVVAAQGRLAGRSLARLSSSYACCFLMPACLPSG